MVEVTNLRSEHIGSEKYRIEVDIAGPRSDAWLATFGRPVPASLGASIAGDRITAASDIRWVEEHSHALRCAVEKANREAAESMRMPPAADEATADAAWGE